MEQLQLQQDRNTKKKYKAKQQHPAKYLQQDVSCENLICKGGEFTDQVEFGVMGVVELV